MTEKANSQKIITTNRDAYHNYHILETFEAGIQLVGTEVKSIREGKVNLKDAYAMLTAIGKTMIRRATGACCCTSARSSACNQRYRRRV
jgi:tmRNA-binding protein